MDNTHLSARGPERLVTRLAAAVLGVAFVFGPSVSFFIHPAQRHELTTAPIALLIASFVMVVLCAAVGIMFFTVGFTGRQPSWLAKRQNLDRR